jgi:hypothetical protein
VSAPQACGHVGQILVSNRPAPGQAWPLDAKPAGEPPLARRANRDQRRQIFIEIAEGARFIAADARLLVIAVCTAVQMVFDNVVGALYMLFVMNALR